MADDRIDMQTHKQAHFLLTLDMHKMPLDLEKETGAKCKCIRFMSRNISGKGAHIFMWQFHH